MPSSCESQCTKCFLLAPLSHIVGVLVFLLALRASVSKSLLPDIYCARYGNKISVYILSVTVVMCVSCYYTGERSRY